MSGRVKVEAPAPVLVSGGPGRLAAALLAAGLGFVAVGLLLPPRGEVFWIAFAVLPPVLAALGAVLARTLGRRLDAGLLGGGEKQAYTPPPAAALPEPLRASLHAATVQALLAELAGRNVPRPARAAADALRAAAVAAWNAAPHDAARSAIARDLPGLVAGLLSGEPAGIRAAEEAAARLAPPAGGVR